MNVSSSTHSVYITHQWFSTCVNIIYSLCIKPFNTIPPFAANKPRCVKICSTVQSYRCKTSRNLAEAHQSVNGRYQQVISTLDPLRSTFIRIFVMHVWTNTNSCVSVSEFLTWRGSPISQPWIFSKRRYGTVLWRTSWREQNTCLRKPQILISAWASLKAGWTNSSNSARRYVFILCRIGATIRDTQRFFY